MAVKSVDQYIETHPTWEQELLLLREVLQNTELEECIKWGTPVYALEEKNVVGITAFKNHSALWFFNGALLKENTALLHNAQEGKTKALRQIRFEKGDEIKPEILQKYVTEAIQNQREGKEIKPVTDKKLVLPPELKAALEKDEELKKSFQQLTKGKQREYADYITEAKREATKHSRLGKVKPMIKDGVGLHDKYKNC
ncbi:YdeI/OmpD-associated family protein [Salegentibacter sp. LM13S]|uniref:YdeI/OmpD-associated family protein n=1 Tax=Salegentibacter lacus TaxID=2873599 RepID=UPI001CCEC225|nr:YdeI/OmpD-associated family protein [Salegentibacter lacus]MBZ9631196.1 YdeI/OmpD-associated family protein [Salegentibacter lacus]